MLPPQTDARFEYAGSTVEGPGAEAGAEDRLERLWLGGGHAPDQPGRIGIAPGADLPVASEEARRPLAGVVAVIGFDHLTLICHVPDPLAVRGVATADVLNDSDVAAFGERGADLHITRVPLVVGRPTEKDGESPGSGRAIYVGPEYGAIAQPALDIPQVLYRVRHSLAPAPSTTLRTRQS